MELNTTTFFSYALQSLLLMRDASLQLYFSECTSSKEENLARFIKHPFFHSGMEYWEKNGVRYNLPRYATEIFSELLERRNEFWTSYSQLIIAALIIIALTTITDQNHNG